MNNFSERIKYDYIKWDTEYTNGSIVARSVDERAGVLVATIL